MSVALLDVNVLIALLDRRHIHHEPTHGWFASAQADGWATCPLSQNAVLRILGQPRYPIVQVHRRWCCRFWRN